MNYWLFKSEPDEYSIDDLAGEPTGQGRWDGIRNYQARNLLRDQVQVDDPVFFYHSSCKQVGIAGIAQVTKAAYPDPAQYDPQSPYFDAKANTEAPRWYCVDLRFVKKFENPISLARLKAEPGLAAMVLLKQGRLSIQPVTDAQWNTILALTK
ncbi:EVE domain-containing protein [Halioxenophilus sp. WMMB6]|uniref:EVE domain-containing protein n=1 Tax=Halioxenophilus sp. WMMB6 TaxID=3073815 RepID=UPI00295F40C3|nr:EVE domain-containing protein [Halioxenophilus sp. WMMB6]